ncbi:prolyl oligopeptidase family serine peptidase [Streptomyces sp. CT34]|uniref:alpha/beta hydrolase family protein n=1 Tax=Streptomyces sp. CT34 TaxID=1553907 RepID=UPI0005B94E54|nr:prolyl oligopeptidase family serine peptidase [Streptomyces sp. CT34]
MVTTAPYGSWASPLDARTVAARDGRPAWVGFVGDDVWWTEPRPAEGDRRALIRRRPDGAEESVLPAPWSVRSRVAEHGGRPWAGTATARGPLVVFSDSADHRLYACEPDGAAAPRPLTPRSPVGGGLRWADPVLRPELGEVWCVLEEPTAERPTDPRRVIAAVPLDGSAAECRLSVRELSDDRYRFLTGPRISPDGRRAAWLAWDHPVTPWDGTLAMVAEVTPEGEFADIRPLAGDPGPGRPGGGGRGEPIAQVEWAAGGSLLCVSGRDGRWQPIRLDPDAADGGETGGRALCPGRWEEFGGPLRAIGQRWFLPLENGTLAVLHGRGPQTLGILDPVGGEVVDPAGPWTDRAATLAVHGTRVIGVAAGPRGGYEIVELDARTGRSRPIAARHTDALDPAYRTDPQVRTFTGPGGRHVHARIYPPHHPERTAPEGELPPYVVWAHGGPADPDPPVPDLGIACFTSRGFGVAAVGRGGPTGHGREDGERPRGRPGSAAVEDCAAVARALADEGSADRGRLAIRGGSGGWVVAASSTSTDLYACGVLRHPVPDLTARAAGGSGDPEPRCSETPAGPPGELPAGDRSPVPPTDRITAPFLLLQAADDAACPPSGGERCHAGAAGRGVPHACPVFPGEGHGLSRADTRARAMEAEPALYAQTFGIARGDVAPLELHT